MPLPNPDGYDLFSLDISTLRAPEEKVVVWELFDRKVLILCTAALLGQDKEMLPEIRSQVKREWSDRASFKQLWNILQPRFGPAGSGLLVLDPRERSVCFYCDNFPFPLWLRKAGGLEEFSNLPSPDQSHSITLTPEELLIFYSPKLINLKNREQQDFGLMHLKSLLVQNQHRTSEEIALTIAQAAWMHQGEIFMEPVELVVLKFLS